jgi:hypothetical protein
MGRLGHGAVFAGEASGSHAEVAPARKAAAHGFKLEVADAAHRHRHIVG